MIPGPVVAQPVNGYNANLHLLLLLTAGPGAREHHKGFGYVRRSHSVCVN